MISQMTKVPISVAASIRCPFFINLSSQVWWKFTASNDSMGYSVVSNHGTNRTLSFNTFVWIPSDKVA